MKRLTLLLLCILGMLSASAQNMLVSHYNSRGSVGAARLFPSSLLLDHDRWQLGLNFNVWVGNQSLRYYDLNEIYQNQAVSRQNVDEFLGRLENTNILGAGQEAMLLGFALAIKHSKRKESSLSFSITDRMAANITYPEQLLQLAWQGNAPFTGDTLKMGDLSVNARYMREWCLGFATDLVRTNQHRLRLGLRVKYLQGLAALYFPDNTIDFYTAPNGESIYINYAINAYTSDLDNFSFFKSQGSGAAMNIGLTYQWSDRISMDIAFNDAGAIWFRKNPSTINQQGNLTFEGFGRNDFEKFNQVIDSIKQEINQQNTTSETFKMPIGAKFAAQLGFRLNRNKDSKFSNQLYLSYIQGTANLPNATTRAYFGIGYKQQVFRFLDTSFSLGIGGFNRYNAGALVGFRITRAVRLNFFSDNISGLIAQKHSTGADIGFSLGLHFR